MYMKNHWQKMNTQNDAGFIVLTVVIIFLFISLTASLALASIVYRESAMVRNTVRSLQSLYVSESLQEDIFFRFVRNISVSATETLSLNQATATATVATVGNTRRIVSAGDAERRVRRTELVLTHGPGASFFYGVQTGQGGFHIGGSAEVIGNLYSNGPITGSGASEVTGSAVSAGPTGLISRVDIGDSGHANRIENSWIDDDAFFQSIHNTTVGGTRHPGSPNPSPVDLPITDEEIDFWQNEAQAGGVHTGPCPYRIGGTTNISLGNIKISCDLTIESSSRVTLTGPVWVRGNLTIGDAAIVSVSPTLQGRSVPIIADNPTDRLNSSRITVGGSAGAFGAGSDSFVVLVSRNTSARDGGATIAISLRGGGPERDLVVYARHGRISIGGSAHMSAVAAHRVDIAGGAVVEYDSGLANMLFSSGPAGGFVLESFRETY
jgi:hypothetical protein